MTYNNQKKACGTYQKNDVTSLTPVQVIARLYEVLERDLFLAKKAILVGEIALKGKKISHALAIIGELQANLNFDEGGEIVNNLNSLYDYLFAEISMANMTNNNEGLSNAIKTVAPLGEAWSELASQEKEKIRPKMTAKPMAMATAGAIAFHATF